MVDHAVVEAWIAKYEQLWRTPGTDRIGDLFTDDASYSMAPFEAPYDGLSAIAELWERERVSADEPFTMETEVIAVDGDRAVARVEVRYHATGSHFRDVWIMRFDDRGRCTAFEEWPFAPSSE
jgi:ketosteroid isomerase-like protein